MFCSFTLFLFFSLFLSLFLILSFIRLKLMEGVGIDDFTLKDVIKPEPHRLKMIFSGMINFAKFREEQLVLFEEFSAKTVSGCSPCWLFFHVTHQPRIV